ncbi:hypothetical protein D3C87_1320410 [compost metagenome]
MPDQLLEVVDTIGQVLDDFLGVLVGVDQVVRVTSVGQRRLQCIATAPHVPLPAAAWAVQRPESLREQLPRPRESEGRDEARAVRELLQPSVG